MKKVDHQKISEEIKDTPAIPAGAKVFDKVKSTFKELGEIVKGVGAAGVGLAWSAYAAKAIFVGVSGGIGATALASTGALVAPIMTCLGVIKLVDVIRDKINQKNIENAPKTKQKTNDFHR
ncbi:MAG: hypothetical protein IKA30_02890 [Alphaproteobacteria bacterium]|nr:hypothetical protein [Alphaproteobacteria bacterium]